MEKAAFAEELREAGLGEYVEQILPFATQCIRLHAPSTTLADLPIGASRIGGLPDLPPGVTWLTRNGRFCEFIAQIDLAEASQYDPTGLLPKEGQLLFFFDGRDYEDKPSLHYQTGSELVRYYTGDKAAMQRAADYPEALEHWQRYQPCAIRYGTDWMLPHSWGYAGCALQSEVFHRDGSSDESPDGDMYEEMLWYLDPDDMDKHHMFGYPDPILQDDPFSYVRYYYLKEAFTQEANTRMQAEWVLLLQISSDIGEDRPGMLWADSSSLYYCIRRDDLIARRFENIVCILQHA